MKHNVLKRVANWREERKARKAKADDSSDFWLNIGDERVRKLLVETGAATQEEIDESYAEYLEMTKGEDTDGARDA